MRTDLSELKIFLEKELQTKRSHNSSYSKNSFARDLGISSTSLKEFLSGHRDLSYKNLNSIFKYLNSNTHCSFCDSHISKVKYVIAGPRKLYICDTCLDKSNHLVKDLAEVSHSK